MSAVTAIYNAPIAHERIPKQWGTTYVSINYNGKSYLGTAMCIPEHKDFFSPRIGRQIAKSRARLKALADAYQSAETEASMKERLYREVLNFGSADPQEIDPTGKFWKNTLRARDRANELHDAIKHEKQCLKSYLKDLETFTMLIKERRAKIDK